MVGRTLQGKQALRRPSCSWGSCQQLKSDKEKKSRGFSPGPHFFEVKSWVRREGKKERIPPKGRPVE